MGCSEHTDRRGDGLVRKDGSLEKNVTLNCRSFETNLGERGSGLRPPRMLLVGEKNWSPPIDFFQNPLFKTVDGEKRVWELVKRALAGFHINAEVQSPRPDWSRSALGLRKGPDVNNYVISKLITKFDEIIFRCLPRKRFKNRIHREKRQCLDWKWFMKLWYWEIPIFGGSINIWV